MVLSFYEVGFYPRYVLGGDEDADELFAFVFLHVEEKYEV